MSELTARPVRYPVPQGDYVPPRPAYRRPGSDHSHLPHSLQVAPAQHEDTSTMTTAATKPAPTADYDAQDAATRRGRLLGLLTDLGPMTRAQLLDAVGRSDRIDNDLFQLRRSGKIRRDREARWCLPEQFEAAEAAAAEQPAAEPEPAKEVSGPAPLTVDEIRKRFLGESAEQPKPRGHDARFAVTSDGSLLVWPDNGQAIELRRAATKQLYRMLHMNQELIA